MRNKYTKIAIKTVLLCISMNVAAVQETYTYTSSSKLASIDGARTDVSDIELYHYDTDNNLSEIVNALAHSVKFQNYNLSGKAQTIIDANNVSTVSAQ